MPPLVLKYSHGFLVFVRDQAHGQQTLLEGKLTWLVYMIGAMVGGYSWSDASASDGEETIDASLARRVFQLAQGLDTRLARCAQINFVLCKVVSAMVLQSAS